MKIPTNDVPHAMPAPEGDEMVAEMTAAAFNLIERIERQKTRRVFLRMAFDAAMVAAVCATYALSR